MKEIYIKCNQHDLRWSLLTALAECGYYVRVVEGEGDMLHEKIYYVVMKYKEINPEEEK